MVGSQLTGKVFQELTPPNNGMNPTRSPIASRASFTHRWTAVSHVKWDVRDGKS